MSVSGAVQYFLLGAAFTSALSYILYRLRDKMGKNTLLIAMSAMTGVSALLFGAWSMMLSMKDTASASSTMTVLDDMRLWRWGFFGWLLGCIPGWLVYTEKMSGDVFLWVCVGILTIALVWVVIRYQMISTKTTLDTV